MPERKKRKGERPDGLIQVSLQIGFKPNGKRDRKFFYGHTRAEAERKRDAYKAQIQANAKYSPDITVREWVDIFKSTYRTRVNPLYYKADDVPYNRLVDELGYLRVSSVKEADLQLSINKLSGKSFSTVEKYRQTIKRVFGKARKNKIITEDPSEDLQLPSYEKGSHRALENWEVRLILENWNNPALHSGIWVMLMLLAGLRRGEMMALQWENIDMESRTLTVCETAVIESNTTHIEKRAKTNAGLRTIPICEPLYAALNSVPTQSRQGFVCLSAKQKPLTESAVSRGIQTFCNVLERILNGDSPSQRGRRNDLLPADIDTQRIPFAFTAHDLRHTFCTFLYDSGVDVKSAAYFMGHADIRVTMEIYTHLSSNKKAQSTASILKYLNGWSCPDTPLEGQ